MAGSGDRDRDRDRDRELSTEEEGTEVEGREKRRKKDEDRAWRHVSLTVPLGPGDGARGINCAVDLERLLAGRARRQHSQQLPWPSYRRHSLSSSSGGEEAGEMSGMSRGRGGLVGLVCGVAERVWWRVADVVHDAVTHATMLWSIGHIRWHLLKTSALFSFVRYMSGGVDSKGLRAMLAQGAEGGEGRIGGAGVSV